MTKRDWTVLLVVAASLTAVIFFAAHYVPSPFGSVRLRDDTVVAVTQPYKSFILFPSHGSELQLISGSQSLELRDGESIRLQSARTSYQITCRISPSPAGLYVEGEWHLHDFPRSAIKKWFTKAE